MAEVFLYVVAVPLLFIRLIAYLAQSTFQGSIILIIILCLRHRETFVNEIVGC